MADRSLLRVCPRSHVDPNREKGEFIVEVWRGAEVVATIYGSREGVHIVSKRLGGRNQPLAIEINDMPTVLVPLLARDEVCPWCNGAGTAFGAPCLICSREKEKT
jgi:hypothetical protein